MISRGGLLVVEEPGSSDRTSCISSLRKDHTRSMWLTTCYRPKWKTYRSRRSSISRWVRSTLERPRLLESLPRDVRLRFSLRAYHGNQSRLPIPIADHDNDPITTLKLFDRLKAFGWLKKARLCCRRLCGGAEKTFRRGDCDRRGRSAVALPRPPLLYFQNCRRSSYSKLRSGDGLPVVRTRYQNVVWATRNPRGRRWHGTVHTVWRNVTPSSSGRRCAEWGVPSRSGGITGLDFVYVEDLAGGLQKAALRGHPAKSTTSPPAWRKHRIRNLADMINEITETIGGRSSAGAGSGPSGTRFGSPWSRSACWASGRGSRSGRLSRTLEWTRTDTWCRTRCCRPPSVLRRRPNGVQALRCSFHL